MINETTQEATVYAGEVTTTRFSGVSGSVCKLEGAILFETALSFIQPTSAHKALLARVFGMALTQNASGTGSIPVADRFLFVTGHTDQVGSVSSNQVLSKRRADATLAVITVDTNIWENIYQAEGWANKTSDGIDIIEVISGEVDLVSDPVLIANYKNNPADRLDLFHRYLLSLRPPSLARTSPLPQPALISGSSSPRIACGLNHPKQNAPRTAVPENRRSEFFFASKSDPGISDCTNYRTWSVVCGGQFLNVQLYLENEYGEPLANQSFTLVLPHGGAINDLTNARGIWLGDNLPTGVYTVNVNDMELTELPAGGVSSSNFKKSLSPTDTKIRFQVIDLNRWFIPKPNPQSTIPQFTRGNIVEPLIDGQTMMRAVHREITRTKSENHYVYITAWGMTANTRMLGASKVGSEVMTVLQAAISRRVDVRGLLWDGLGRSNTPEQQQIDDDSQAPRGQAILDNETLNLGSHHQKTTVVNGQNGLVAFCGGIDLTVGRWDTQAHTIPSSNRDNFPNNPKPWHDVHTKITGPAAGDIETNFRERWNAHPNRRSNGRTLVPTHSIPKPLANGSHIVQTLRTLPPQMRYPFAPSGELGVLNAYLRVISNARDYIYIEDQYLVFDEISIAIGRVLSRLRGKVIIVIPRDTEEPVVPFCNIPQAMLFHRFEFIENLRRIDATKIEVYHLHNASNQANSRDIYVHAKLMIVDDIWATIGSANIGRRSLTHDSEINIAVIDGAVVDGRRKFAKELRIALWKEHLGVSRNAVNDPVASIGLWASAAASKSGHVVEYPRRIGNDCPIWDSSVDPDGR